jgi:hypothetical protein
MSDRFRWRVGGIPRGNPYGSLSLSRPMREGATDVEAVGLSLSHRAVGSDATNAAEVPAGVGESSRGREVR